MRRVGSSFYASGILTRPLFGVSLTLPPARRAGPRGKAMHAHRQGLWQLALVLMVFSSAGHAQSTVTPEDEYRKLTRVTEDIQTLGDTPFGEAISLYSGSLSFEQTDISAAGTGPLLQVTRTGFYPEITDGCERVENFKSSLAVLRRILGLWCRSMYSNTSALAASSVGYVMR